MYGLVLAVVMAAEPVVERDIVVYGSSPAAIATAVQAKRMGKSVVIVSPETRIGGLTTGGLGQTDIGNKSAFGGIALEFYRDVARHYRDPANWKWQSREDYLPDGQCAGSKGADTMWTFEPSAALGILEGWVKRDGLDIRRGSRLDREKKVKTAGEGEARKIVSFSTLDGVEYRGKMFVDATYEGDLMAAAGVSYFVGREDNAVYGETISGNAPKAAGADHHNFVTNVSAYVVAGDRSSGLLPGVEPYDPESRTGAGDRRVQAYCFRMCLTDCPENRIPFMKPEGYDERDYELLFRNFEAQVAQGVALDDPWGRGGAPWINSKMPNRKTDTNNRTGFSTDFIGHNWNWPEASYAEREQILKAHLRYQQGLMWTLANHPRVPQRIRDVVSPWGTCRDEFADGLGNGWQGQLYVREARRLVGDYVMTEHHCRGTSVAPRPVAMGAYGMDSHHVRRVEMKEGWVRNEGNVEDYKAADGMSRFPPYGIDYGAIVPKAGECANLIVPVCISASHMAYGSIRMEPVFFALGQVAGTAAAQAIDAGVSVQNLAYAPLAKRLLDDGQVLATLLSCPGEVSEKAGWRCVAQEAGKPVYIPFEGVYESKGGRIESPKFGLGKGVDENAWYQFSFDAVCAVDGYWWVDVFGPDGKALPDMNSRLYASEDWKRYDIVVSVQPGAVAAQLAFVTTKGVKIRDVSSRRLSVAEAAKWCDDFYRTLPQVDLSVPADAWDRLPKSKALLQEGKPITILMLGDSIVNDTWCGNVSALIKERYPQAKIVLSVRGSTGCWYYRDPKQFDSYVLRHKPDLLMIGGISNGKDEADFSTAEADMTEVIRLAQKHSIEVAVMSPPPSYEFRKTVDDASWDENVVIEMYDSWVKRNRRWQPLRRDYQRSAVAKTGAAYFDLTTAPCDAILKSKKPLGWFKRDAAHNDDRGKQLIAQRLAAYFGALAEPGATPELAPGDLHAKDLSVLKSATRPSGEPIVVVAEGEARLPVVYADGQANKWAAEQLRDTISEMTGATPALVCERAGKAVTNAPAFYIGATRAAQQAGLAAPSDHPEAHRVVTRDGSVYFLGKADFAVTDWCERELGARYYWPMKPADMVGNKATTPVYGKCVVKTRGLVVRPVDWNDRPVFACRDNWPYENTAWNRWAKGGDSHRGGVNVHAPHKWWKEPDALEHVEIFALSADGKRPTSPLLCYGNPKTLEYYKMRVKKGIEAHLADPKAKDSSGGILNYKKKVVTISQWDCGVNCACAYCRKLFDEKLGDSGSGSPIIWGYFTREFAKWLKAEYPDWKIAILPYINTCDVPPDPEDPSKPLDLSMYGNVEAELCTMPGLAMLKNKACKEHEENLIRQWVKCTGNPVLNWHYSCWPAEFTAAPFVYGETIQKHYADMRKDVVGTFINGGYDIARLSLSGYVWMRCLYNPEVDVQAIYDGFARRMFGPAAEPMRELIRLQEQGWNRQWDSDLCSIKNIYTLSYPRNEVLKMIDLFAEAERLAAGDSVICSRIAWYKSGFEKFFKESEEQAAGTAFVPHQIKKALAPPVVDGRLDDACWAKAEEHAFVSALNKTNAIPRYAGFSKMVWYPGEDGGVTFGFRFQEPALSAMQEGVQGDPWGQDTYEIFLDISGSGDGHFYQILIDGTSRPSFFTDGIPWKPTGVKVAKAVETAGWTVEVFVPFRDLRQFPKAQIPTTSANGCVWTGNFCRWRVGDAKREPKESRLPGSVPEMTRLYTRYNHWNKDPAAFGTFMFVE